eukprot:CAMPEP_0194268346 /NCGR_PEP_ID=MMETSP0169-20130528/2696_1 /TAXON_ID=218684 /ORGANISM="Corethron pennatum, Strain L29A3" /LENGTH=138 /DNA_ID=CAMNT_0039009551 /DNA_START=363 /DNA_END=779 /DNA_ORIENTATION=-
MNGLWKNTQNKRYVFALLRTPSPMMQCLSIHQKDCQKAKIAFRCLSNKAASDFNEIPPIILPPPPPPVRLRAKSLLIPLSILTFFGFAGWVSLNPDPEYQQFWYAAESGRPIPGTNPTLNLENDEDEVEVVDDEGLED